MKEASWKECVDSNNALSTTIDHLKISSLQDMATRRMGYCRKNVIDGKSADFIFEDYYSSLLELLHALILLNGYKVNNHICVGYYLRDVLQRTDLYRLFDDCRFKRNSITYYGKPMDFEVATESIQRCISLIREIEKILEKELRTK